MLLSSGGWRARDAECTGQLPPPPEGCPAPMSTHSLEVENPALNERPSQGAAGQVLLPFSMGELSPGPQSRTSAAVWQRCFSPRMAPPRA